MVKRFYFLFFALILLPVGLKAQNVCEEHYYIISDNIDDSVFCAKHYPYYDFDNKCIIYGTMTPEKLIQGKDMPLIDILSEVKKLILQRFNALAEDKILSISILVDKNGKVRGGIINNQQEIDPVIMRYTYDALKKYNYVPANNRGKPITFCFSFIMKLKAN